MGVYSYILEQQGKSTAEKLAEFTAAIGWRDELATYRNIQDEYEMRTTAAAEQGISLLDTPPYTDEELAVLDAESAAYYDAFAANYVATAAFTGSGSGTADDPYIITNRAELEAMADDLTAYYQLDNDIDLGGSSSPWTPIGSRSAQFTGTLDGNGYTISNVHLGSQDAGIYQAMGIFGVISGSSISNLGVYIVGIDNIPDAQLIIGGIVGCCWGNSTTTIEGCHVTVDSVQLPNGVSGNPNHIGGIMGMNYRANPHTSFPISISNCYSEVQISGDSVYGYVAGGIAATSFGYNFINCYSVASIDTPSSNTYWVGGIVGNGWHMTGQPIVTISNCMAFGSVSGSEDTHRVLGRVDPNPASTGYAASDMLVNGAPVSGSGGLATMDGLSVSPSTYHTQAFWQDTLGWDFQTVWCWDDTEQLPKLRVFGYAPIFPLNVEIGSPKYTTVSQINYSAGAIASVQVTPATSGTTPVRNSYYTFQSQDGQHWMTGYVGKWTNNGGTWTAEIIWSSSNTDSLPAQSICWCIWTKEYYQSIIDRLSS